jgi:hypothetical protein
VYEASAILIHGYWGTRHTKVARRTVRGRKRAYRTARWLAIRACFRYPAWMYNVGIAYRISSKDTACN